MPKDHRDKPKYTVDVVKYYPMGPRAGETRPKKGGAGDELNLVRDNAVYEKAADEIVSGTCRVGGRRGGAYADITALRSALTANGRSILAELQLRKPPVDVSTALAAPNSAEALRILKNLSEQSVPSFSPTSIKRGRESVAPMMTGKQDAISGPLQLSAAPAPPMKAAVNKIVEGFRELDMASMDAAGKVLGKNVKTIIASLAATGGLAAAGACGALVAAPSLIVAAAIAIPEFAKAFQADPKSDIESLIKKSRTKWQEQRDKLFVVAKNDSDEMLKRTRSTLDRLSPLAPKLPLPPIVEKAAGVLDAVENYFKTFFPNKQAAQPSTEAAVSAIKEVTDAVKEIAAAPPAEPAAVTAAAAEGLTLPGQELSDGAAAADAMKEGSARRTRRRHASAPRRTRRSSFGRHRGGSRRRRE